MAVKITLNVENLRNVETDSSTMTNLACQSTNSISFGDRNFHHHQLDQYLSHGKSTINTLVMSVI